MVIKKALILPVNENLEILIQDRRNIKKDVYLDWGYFGGSVERLEEPLDAAIRETKSELSVEPKADELIFLGTFEGSPIIEGEVERYVYLWKFTVEVEAMKLKEGQGMKFVELDELHKIMESDADKQIALKAKEFLYT